MEKLIKIKNKYSIKIPKNVKIVYCSKTNLLIFENAVTTKTLKLTLKIFRTNNFIIVSRIPTYNISKNISKNLNKLQGTLISKIKLTIIEISNVLYKKLVLVGVGYRTFITENCSNQIMLKLGYSHLIYHKIPQNLDIFCSKYTKLFIFGLTSYDNLTQVLASIRRCKTPEPYKGKGILYFQENIKLKKGKKI